MHIFNHGTIQVTPYAIFSRVLRHGQTAGGIHLAQQIVRFLDFGQSAPIKKVAAKAQVDDGANHKGFVNGRRRDMRVLPFHFCEFVCPKRVVFPKINSSAQPIPCVIAGFDVCRWVLQDCFANCFVATVKAKHQSRNMLIKRRGISHLPPYFRVSLPVFVSVPRRTRYARALSGLDMARSMTSRTTASTLASVKRTTRFSR